MVLQAGVCDALWSGNGSFGRTLQWFELVNKFPNQKWTTFNLQNNICGFVLTCITYHKQSAFCFLSVSSDRGTAAFTWSVFCWCWFYPSSPDARAQNNRSIRAASRPANTTASPIRTTTSTRKRKPREDRESRSHVHCVAGNFYIHTERHTAAVTITDLNSTSEEE